MENCRQTRKNQWLILSGTTVSTQIYQNHNLTLTVRYTLSYSFCPKYYKKVHKLLDQDHRCAEQIFQLARNTMRIHGLFWCFCDYCAHGECLFQCAIGILVLCCTILNSTESHDRQNFLPFFSNFEKCRPEEADDVISNVAVE